MDIKAEYSTKMEVNVFCVEDYHFSLMTSGVVMGRRKGRTPREEIRRGGKNGGDTGAWGISRLLGALLL